MYKNLFDAFVKTYAEDLKPPKNTLEPATLIHQTHLQG